MTPGMWWTDTLEAFAQAFDLRYDLVQEKHSAVRVAGEWWQRGGSWCVQLDAWTHACWLDPVEQPSWRHFLTVSLENARAAMAQQLPWQQVVTSYFKDLIANALTDESVAKDRTPKPELRLSTRDLHTPGSFAWLEFAKQSGNTKDEFQHMVEEVVEAFVEVVFVGWTEQTGAGEAALVFLQEHSGPGGHTGTQGAAGAGGYTGSQEHAGSGGYTGSPGHTGSAESLESRENEDTLWDDWTETEVNDGTRRPSGHRPDHTARKLRALLESLESDAMVAVKATMGQSVTDTADWAVGIWSLVEAWRERTWFAPAEPVYRWGQRPVAYLLSNLSTQQIEPFLQMVAAVDQNNLLLSADLMETLQGVLAANLNISEASRLLYLHRNTLMNRIDRIHTQTGYDIRQFNDALILWMTQVLLLRKRQAASHDGKQP